MTWNEIKEKVDVMEFPLEYIKNLARELNGKTELLIENGLSTSSSFHVLDKDSRNPIKHSCMKTVYTKKKVGSVVLEFSYKFCEECEKVVNKRIVALNDVTNTAYINIVE